jgi:hypothetical protein
MLELGLTDEARERVAELRALSEKVQDGEEDARTELRRALRQSAPGVLAGCSNTVKVYRGMLAEKMAIGDPLVKEATLQQAERMVLEFAGEDPTPLEVLLSERVASLWILTELQEALMAAWYYKGGGTPMSFVLQMARLQESVHRRYLAAIKMLAQVQKLQGPSRVQVNIGGNQTNVSR